MRRPQSPFGVPQFLIATIKIETCLLVLSIVSAALLYLVSALLIDNTVAYDEELVRYSILSVTPFLYTAAEFGTSAAIILLMCFIFAVLQIITLLLRAVLWRVVEYGKGPVAAVA